MNIRDSSKETIAVVGLEPHAGDCLTFIQDQTSLDAVRNGVAVALLHDRAFLRISGSDATRWLNGMVTNSIQSLGPGFGNYNFLLSAQGRIQGDCTVYREQSDPPAFLLATSGDQINNLQQLLDKFIIMDDVELTRVYEEEQSLVLLGARSSTMLQSLGLPSVSPFQHVLANISEGNVLLLSGSSADTTELRGTPALIESLRAHSTALGALSLDTDDLEALRIITGTPRFSVDIRERDLPQETSQSHALHFAKGCYVGQEIVERIRSRGQVHRLLTAFRLDGEVPTLPAALEANGKPAGELTSTVRIGPQLYALGYARREALETHQPLTYLGGAAIARTT